MASAIFGLIGVLLGSLLAGAKEWFFLRRNNARDAAFLVVQVVGQLDRYVLACSSVAADEGLNQGQPDESGYRYAQVKTPIFEPDALKVEWRAIPVNLMYEVLDLPYKAVVAQHTVDAASENADPPDFDEFFEERQLQFAGLGLLAAKLADQLRRHAKLPSRSVSEWDPVDFMHRTQGGIQALRAERGRQWEEKSRAANSDA
jgi:hypothetical protein